MKRISFTQSHAIALGLVGAIIVACSAESGTDDQNPNVMGQPTSTVPGATTAPGVNSGMPGATTAAGGATTAPGVDTTTPAASTAPAAGPMSTCTDVTYMVTGDTPAFPGVTGIYGYGDGVTTLCIDVSMPGKVCANGVVPMSDKDGDPATDTDTYANYGAGIGLQLSLKDADGNLIEPWDAAALGIASLSFDVTGITGGRPIRVQMGQVDDPAIVDAAANYGQNSFVWGKDAANDMKADKTGVSVLLNTVQLPTWTNVLDPADATGATDAAGQLIDLAQLDALQFQITTEPTKTGFFDFCISNMQWLDAAGAPVTVPVRTAPPAGSASVVDTAAVPTDTAAPMTSDSAPMTSASAMDSAMPSSTAAAPSMSASAAGPDPALYDAAWTAISASCAGAGCHNNVKPPAGPFEGVAWAISDGKEATKAALEAGAAKVASEVMGNLMPPQSSPPLSNEAKAAILDWAASL